MKQMANDSDGVILTKVHTAALVATLVSFIPVESNAADWEWQIAPMSGLQTSGLT